LSTSSAKVEKLRDALRCANVYRQIITGDNN